MTDLRVAVIGGGLGGLTAAATLGQEGVRCTIFERTTPTGTGGGIQISPNAALVLHRLGLGAALSTAVRPVRRELRRWRDNTVIGQIELGAAAEARYGAPYYTLRRADLHRALVDLVAERCGADAIRFGHRCVSVVDDADSAVVCLDNGSVHRADFIIGADGLHSVVRGRIANDAVQYSGHAVYRALIPADRVKGLVELNRVLVWLGPGRHCVCYPVDGGRTINLVATVPTALAPQPVHAGGNEDLLAAYAGWNEVVRALLSAADQVDFHGLFDRPPLPRWHRGRLAVLGDAAHPMLPFLAQGAAQAIEDAASIARSLCDFAGFEVYEAVRRHRVDRLDAAIRDSVRTHHLFDGPAQRDRDAVIAAGNLSTQDWLYQTDASVGALRR